MMLYHDDLRIYAERYAGLKTEPLEIQLELHNALGGYDPLFLDNLLAWCVVQEATHGKGLPNNEDGYDIPLPLRCFWRDERGFPLWAATQFWPEDGMVYQGVSYWHKRSQRGNWTHTRRGRFVITNMTGRYVERRIPMPTRLASRWVAWAVGNRDEIARLLGMLTHVGKRRGIGYGEIRRWIVRPVPEFSLVREGALMRAMPLKAIEEMAEWPSGMVPEGQPSLVGWTPPPWKSSLFALGWWAGTPVRGANDADWLETWWDGLDGDVA